MNVLSRWAGILGVQHATQLARRRRLERSDCWRALVPKSDPSVLPRAERLAISALPPELKRHRALCRREISLAGVERSGSRRRGCDTRHRRACVSHLCVRSEAGSVASEAAEHSRAWGQAAKRGR